MNAHQYWASRTVSPRFADPSLPYRQAIADEVAAWKPESVIEFGCGAGANLAAIAQRLPDARLVGVDINPAAIAVARDRSRSATYRDDLPTDEAFGLGLTVSALDHVQDPFPVIERLFGMTGVLILIEPWAGFEGRIEENPDGTPATPYTYSWDYPAMLRSIGARVSIRKMPLREAGVGPLYRRYTAR